MQPYRAVRAFPATSNGRRYRAQMHPTDESALLLRLLPTRGERMRFDLESESEIEVVFGKTSKMTIVVKHVQHVPSWKGDIHRAEILFAGTETTHFMA